MNCACKALFYSRLVLTPKRQGMDDFIHYKIHALNICKLKSQLELGANSEANRDAFLSSCPKPVYQKILKLNGNKGCYHNNLLIKHSSFQNKSLHIGSINGVSVKRGVRASFFGIFFMYFFLSFNPNSDFSHPLCMRVERKKKRH